MSTIAERLHELHLEVAETCLRYGRSPESVRIVAVSKTKPIEEIQEAIAAGHTLFGENRVQELVPKATTLPQAEWHLVGSLQRNKVKYIAPFVAMIHSLDSIELAEEINRHAGKNNRLITCLIQINISQEQQKSGIFPNELPGLLSHIGIHCPFVQIAGLMGIAQETENEEIISSQFEKLRKLAATTATPNVDRIHLKELSMGMSTDWKIAVAHGATLIRVGSRIFGHRS
jgi:hypothetical protein